MLDITIKTMVVSHFMQNARVLLIHDTKTAICVDPGYDAEKIFNACGPYHIDSIFLTHCHLDHAGAVQDLQKKIKSSQGKEAPLYYHSLDTPIANNIENFASGYQLAGQYRNVPTTTTYLDHLEKLQLGPLEVTLHFTPGHAPGHVAFSYQGHKTTLETDHETETTLDPICFSGDALFKGSIGRTDLPYGNHQQLLDSIQSELFPLDSNTRVLSGHGPNTTIGEEKQTNPFFA